MGRSGWRTAIATGAALACTAAAAGPADGMIVFGANDNTTDQGTLYAFMP